MLVTGCSSGIGEATARVLHNRGWRVIPTARKQGDLDQLREAGFEPVALDLAHADSVSDAVDAVLKISGGSLGGVVNNAAYAQPGAMEDLSRDLLRAQFEVNVFGTQELTNLLIPVFRKQGWGRIVYVSSVFGRMASPMVGAYCGTKYAIEAMADALRVELRGNGIGVSLIEPGAIVTSLRKNAANMMEETLDKERARYGAFYAHEAKRRKNQTKKPDFFNRPPEEVAEKIAHALESPRPRIRYGVTVTAGLVEFARRFLPTGLIDRLQAFRMPRA